MASVISLHDAANVRNMLVDATSGGDILLGLYAVCAYASLRVLLELCCPGKVMGFTAQQFVLTLGHQGLVLPSCAIGWALGWLDNAPTLIYTLTGAYMASDCIINYTPVTNCVPHGVDGPPDFSWGVHAHHIFTIFLCALGTTLPPWPIIEGVRRSVRNKKKRLPRPGAWLSAGRPQVVPTRERAFCSLKRPPCATWRGCPLATTPLPSTAPQAICILLGEAGSLWITVTMLRPNRCASLPTRAPLTCVRAAPHLATHAPVAVPRTQRALPHPLLRIRRDARVRSAHLARHHETGSLRPDAAMSLPPPPASAPCTLRPPRCPPRSLPGRLQRRLPAAAQVPWVRTRVLLLLFTAGLVYDNYRTLAQMTRCAWPSPVRTTWSRHSHPLQRHDSAAAAGTVASAHRRHTLLNGEPARHRVVPSQRDEGSRGRAASNRHQGQIAVKPTLQGPKGRRWMLGVIRTCGRREGSAGAEV